MILLSCFAGILLLASKINLIYNKSTDEIFYDATVDVEEASPASKILGSFINPQNSAPNKCSSKRSLLFVSTTDGSFTCLNAQSGELLWSVPAEKSLISSSINSINSIRELADVKFTILPSLNGNLYKWNGDRLDSVPLSTNYLLGNIKKLPDGSFIVGGKEVSINGVDVSSGELTYECSMTGCQPVRKTNDIKSRDILSLRRTQKTIRVFEPKTGQEKWNYSVGNFEIELIEGESGEVHIDSSCGDHIDDGHFRFVIQDGVVASDSWTFKFNSPIANAWNLEDKQLKSLNVFSAEQFQLEGGFNADSLVYLGLYQGSMYVQHPPRKQIRDSKTNTFAEELVLELPVVGRWRPLISTSPSRTPALNSDQSSTALSSLDYPFDNGFFLYSNTTAVGLPIKQDEDDDDVCSTENPDVCNAENQSVPTIESAYDFAPITIRDWWKEILVLSFLIAIGINITGRFLKKRLGIGSVVVSERASAEAEPVIEEAVEELPQSIKRVKANSVSIATDPITEMNSEDAEVGSSTTSTITAVTPNNEFTSRYLVDFDHLECLGKGGFGVVFKARKKIDEYEYAIKRIYLPQCEEAKTRMMREVRALAALEHSGIVRYFHAWWEAPPKDWQFELDRTVLMKDVDDAPSYVFSQDWALEVNSLSEHQNKSKDNQEERRKQSADSLEDSLERCFDFESRAELDLLRHNDVFHSDESIGEDSFICFKGSGEENHESTRLDLTNSSVTSDSDMSLSSRGSYNNKRSDTLRAENDEDNEDSFIIFEKIGNIREESESGLEEGAEEETREGLSDQLQQARSKGGDRTNRRVVGKCCTRSSECLNKPPLFLYIQMQLCRQETLKDWLVRRSPTICVKESFEIFMQIRDAVEYFHKQGMMHRDLKPANIFFSMDGSVKVGDFGLVTAITRPSRGKSKNHGFLQDENHTGQVGTQLYMSPEQASGKPYSQKVDLYALGLILFELLCYFSTQMERIRLIYGLKRGDLPMDLENTPHGNLVLLLTNEDPSQRPDAKDLTEQNAVLIKEFKQLTSEN